MDKLGTCRRCSAMLVNWLRRNHILGGHLGESSGQLLVVDRGLESMFYARFSCCASCSKLPQRAVVRQPARSFAFGLGVFAKSQCEGPSGPNIGARSTSSRHTSSRRIIQRLSECSLNNLSKDNNLGSVQTVSTARSMWRIERRRKDRPALIQGVRA